MRKLYRRLLSLIIFLSIYSIQAYAIYPARIFQWADIGINCQDQNGRVTEEEHDPRIIGKNFIQKITLQPIPSILSLSPSELLIRSKYERQWKNSVIYALKNGLTEVDLSNKIIDSQQFTELFSEGGLLHETVFLDLSHTTFDLELLSDLPISLRALRLRHISLLRNQLYRISHLKQLERLDLGWNSIGNIAIQSLMPSLPQLQSLYLQNIGLSDDGAIAIAIHLPLIQDLDLSQNRISSTGAMVLAKNLPEIRILELNSNEIGNEGAMAIAIKLTTLKTLDIRYNQINSTVADYLREVFLKKKVLI